MIKIRKGIFFIRTQAGFRKALKDFHTGTEKCDQEVHNYPKAYPCLAILHSDYNGGLYVTRGNFLHVNKLKDIIAMDEADRAELKKKAKDK